MLPILHDSFIQDFNVFYEKNEKNIGNNNIPLLKNYAFMVKLWKYQKNTHFYHVQSIYFEKEVKFQHSSNIF